MSFSLTNIKSALKYSVTFQSVTIAFTYEELRAELGQQLLTNARLSKENATLQQMNEEFQKSISSLIKKFVLDKKTQEVPKPKSHNPIIMKFHKHFRFVSTMSLSRNDKLLKRIALSDIMKTLGLSKSKPQKHKYDVMILRKSNSLVKPLLDF